MSENELDLQNEETQEEEMDWEARALRAEARAKRYLASHKELQTLKQGQAEKPPVVEVPKKKEGFGYDELAFIGYKQTEMGLRFTEEDQKLLLDEINATGRTLKDVLDFRHVRDELKKRAEDRKTLEALPEAKNRAGGIGKDSVDYWLARGELPPYEQTDLRREVLNARIKRETNRDKFTRFPLV